LLWGAREWIGVGVVDEGSEDARAGREPYVAESRGERPLERAVE
jgi:hypothetical protein